MIRTIVFDFGKVVAHFDHRLTSRRLAAYTTVPEPTVFRRIYGGTLEDDYESGRIRTAEFLAQVRRLCELECTEEQLVAAYSDIFWPNEGTCRLLPRLAESYPLLLLSNTNELHARQFLPQLHEPLAHFRHIIMSHQVGARKPRPEIFAHAQELAGCPPQQCLFIDDLPANVEGARRFGWQGLVFRDADALCHDLRGLGVAV